MEVYVARQPIFTTQKKIFGYELLFRDSMENFVPENLDGDKATSKLLSNSFFTIGLDAITGGKRAFINYTENLLLKKLPLMFPKEAAVVEILEDVEPTEEVIRVCRQIAARGYKLALDDFIYAPKMKPLMQLADIIKIDLFQTPMDKMEEYLKPISVYKAHLLAEKVETHEEFVRGVELGFKYFQGYFFCKPEIIRGKDIPSSQVTLLQIMAEANKENFDFNDIRKMIERDISISYKLMRYINSAYFRRIREISTIKEALVLMGEKEIRRFISMVAMSNLATGKPDELIVTSCIRAKFCELIGSRDGSGTNPSELFTLGLFSLIDAILDQPMEAIMGDLPLKQEIREALVEGKGEMVNYLKLAENYEKGNWDKVSEAVAVLGKDEEKLPELFIQACKWSHNFASI